MDGGAWWATVHGVAKSRTWQSDFTVFSLFHHSYHLRNSKGFRRFVPGMRTKAKHTFLVIKHNTAETLGEQLWSEPRVNSNEKGLEVGWRWWGWGGAERPLPERKDRLEGKSGWGRGPGPWEGEGATCMDSCGLPAGWGRKPLRPWAEKGRCKFKSWKWSVSEDVQNHRLSCTKFIQSRGESLRPLTSQCAGTWSCITFISERGTA